MEFEVKRNSAFEKHFKISTTDFVINAQGMNGVQFNGFLIFFNFPSPLQRRTI
jgi:hypothetical protein